MKMKFTESIDAKTKPHLQHSQINQPLTPWQEFNTGLSLLRLDKATFEKL